jgi:hypothetical protein
MRNTPGATDLHFPAKLGARRPAAEKPFQKQKSINLLDLQFKNHCILIEA